MNTTRITIEVFSSPGCGKCGHAKEVLRKLVDELDNDLFDWREVNILDEMDHAVALGVMSTPSIAINGELVFTSLPTSKKLRLELERQLEQHS